MYLDLDPGRELCVDPTSKLFHYVKKVTKPMLEENIIFIKGFDW